MDNKFDGDSSLMFYCSDSGPDTQACDDSGGRGLAEYAAMTIAKEDWEDAAQAFKMVLPQEEPRHHKIYEDYRQKLMNWPGWPTEGLLKASVRSNLKGKR